MGKGGNLSGAPRILLVIPAKAGGALQQRSWSSSVFTALKTLDPSLRWDDGEAISKIMLAG
jgi:hypothetical protein